jgi:hypothetical protein
MNDTPNRAKIQYPSAATRMQTRTMKQSRENCSNFTYSAPKGKKSCSQLNKDHFL